mmetsp:Transcript_6870/g.16155  ORF Transcript_6870/g.16155 Transcript_6870/m.16155 type:complete len:147 (+) Transcript_6870:116-556(+)
MLTPSPTSGGSLRRRSSSTASPAAPDVQHIDLELNQRPDAAAELTTGLLVQLRANLSAGGGADHRQEEPGAEMLPRAAFQPEMQAALSRQPVPEGSRRGGCRLVGQRLPRWLWRRLKRQSGRQSRRLCELLPLCAGGTHWRSSLRA